MILNLDNPNQLRELTSQKRDFELVFTSGCFDLLHAGHIHFFEELHKKVAALHAKNSTTSIRYKVLVAIHSDADIKEKKGQSRPIYSEQERLNLLNSLKTIDYVGVWHGWESIVDLVFALKPDYLVTNTENLKFTNWENNWQKVAADTNSHLIGIPRVDKDLSTSNYINKIKNI